MVCKEGKELAREIEHTVLPDQTAALWALGQAGFLIRVGKYTIGLDLYLTNSIENVAGTPWVRAFPPPIEPDKLPQLDAVLCTHHHEDHMDIGTLQVLQSRTSTPFIIPRAHEAKMKGWGFYEEQLVGMNHMETYYSGGAEIKALAAMHDKFEQDAHGNHCYLGYIIRVGGMTIYHAGDTIGFPELINWLREENVDIAMIPMNGRDFTRTSAGIVGNCNYREAADLAVAIGADLAIPMHIGMFPHNDENPAFFVDYWLKNYPGRKFHIMAPGERFIYMK